MDPKHGNFFTCPKLHTMSLAFKLKYMSKKATHAVFLMAPPDKKTLKSKGKWTTDTDPDTDPEYPGRISLEANRVVEFVPKVSSGSVWLNGGKNFCWRGTKPKTLIGEEYIITKTTKNLSSSV